MLLVHGPALPDDIIAQRCRWLLDAYIEKGFSRDEAMRLLVAFIEADGGS